MIPSPSLHPEVQRIVDQLLAQSAESGELSLDELGEALSVRAVTTDEIGVVMEALEAAGRTISEPPSDAPRDLRRVLLAVRALKVRLGRSPQVPEIAMEAGLSMTSVRSAAS